MHALHMNAKNGNLLQNHVYITHDMIIIRVIMIREM